MMKRASEYYYEEIGENFDRWMSDYDVKQRLRLIRSLLPPDAGGMSCLEVGCGTGRVSEALLPLVGQLTVSDISAALARSVGERLGVDGMQQDACSLTVSDNAYDLVVSSECIEHTPSPKTAIREIARVTRPGGAVIITSPNRVWYPALWIAQKMRLRRFAGNELWLFPQEAAKVFAESGFGEVQLGGCHLWPWQIPGSKAVLPFFDRFDRTLYPAMINYAISGTKRTTAER
jgi:ubiquinone/menaquinone biosynthesis C-methylase UbiE